MKVFVVEDEVFQLEDLLITLEELGHECLGHTDDPFQAVEQLESLEVDVALLDLHLNGRLAGIQLAKRIKDLYDIPVIFITSEVTTEVIKEAVDTEPIAYLTKPVNKNDLGAALILASSQGASSEETTEKVKDALFVKNGNKLHKVALADICYAFTDTKNYCSLVTVEGDKYSLRSSMSGLINTLDSDNFVQTHRAFIVNKEHIRVINEGDQSVEMLGKSIPIGKSFKKEMYALLNIK